MGTAPLRALEPILADVARVGGWLWQRGWAERNAGNLSLDVSRLHVEPDVPSAAPFVRSPIPDAGLAGRDFLVTVAGARFRDLAERPEAGVVLLRIAPGADGYQVLWDPSRGGHRATSELPAHLLVHARLAEASLGHPVVLHTHPTHLLALNHTPVGASEPSLNRALWSMLPEVKLLVPEGVALAPYRLPGTAELAEETSAALRRHRVVVWDRHGALAVERDLVEAFDLLDVLDKAARIFLLCLASGFEPRGLGAAELADLAELATRLGLGP